MGGLRQACARTIHGFYYYWVGNPFFMFLWIAVVWGDMGKPINTTTMLDMCGMNNNNNDHTLLWVLFFLNHRYIYYLLNTAVSWVQRVPLTIAGDRGLIPCDGAIDCRHFYEPLIVITCFREGVFIAVDTKWWSLIVETESIYSSDIPDMICDWQVDGLGGVSFVMH